MTIRRARGTGGFIKRGSIWWIRYYADGKRVDESSESKKKADAVELLNKRLVEVAEGRYQGAKAGKLTFEDLSDIITDHYDDRRSAFRAEDALIHLKRLFGRYRVKNLTADRLTWYVKTRRAEGAAPATVKYELAVLRKAFKLTLRAEKIQRIPAFPEIKVENTRTEFVDPAEFEKLIEALPKQLRGVIEFAYHTG